MGLMRGPEEAVPEEGHEIEGGNSSAEIAREPSGSSAPAGRRRDKIKGGALWPWMVCGRVGEC